MLGHRLLAKLSMMRRLTAGAEAADTKPKRARKRDKKLN